MEAPEATLDPFRTVSEEVFSETGHGAVNRTDPNEQESVVIRPDLEAKVP